MTRLNNSEIEVLMMVNKEIPWKKGAWVNACYEFLQETGFLDRTLLGTAGLTEKGRDALERWHSGN